MRIERKERKKKKEIKMRMNIKAIA